MSSSASCRAWLPPDWLMNLSVCRVFQTSRSDWPCGKRNNPSQRPRRIGPPPTAEETTKGVVGGGIIGGLAGLLTAAGFVAMPGLAPLLAGGSLISLLGATGASIVAASGLGAVTGGLVGALISINLPETALHH